MRDVVLDGDAYTGDWENSDCAEDGDVVDADVGDEAPELVWSQECQDDQLLTRPGERRRRRKENLVRRRCLSHKRWTYDCLSYKTFRDGKVVSCKCF